MKVQTIFIAVVLLAGTLALPLTTTSTYAQQDNFDLIAFSGDWDCNTQANNSWNQVKASDPDLIIINGDTSYESSIGCFTDDIEERNLQSITKAVIGNHDSTEDGSSSIEGQLKSYFGLPSSGYAKYEHTMDNGKKAVIYLLNTQLSLSQGSTQYNWLNQDLQTITPQVQSGDIQYVLFATHKMIWNGGSCADHGQESYAQNVRDLMYQHGAIADVFLMGHDHNFQLSKPMKTGNVITDNTDQDSVTFVVAGLPGRTADSASGCNSQTLDAFGGSSNHGVAYLKLFHNEDKIDIYFKTNSGTTKAQHTLLNVGNTLPVEICDDGIDNDGDGLIDGNDPDCQVPPEEICGNGIDDDGDGLIDEGCPVGGSGKLEVVSATATHQDSGKTIQDSFDNNCDTRWSAEPIGAKGTYVFNGTYSIDKVFINGYHYDKSYKFKIEGGDLPDKIYTVPAPRDACPALTEFDISDQNIEADRITLINEGNSGSSYLSFREVAFETVETVPQEICGNGIDDDLDGLIDEDCPAEICGDGIDNNGDGQVDENCPDEICGDGIDNNGNGQVDENCLPRNVSVNVINEVLPHDIALNQTETTILPAGSNTTINVLADNE